MQLCRQFSDFIALSHPTNANWIQIMLWELLAADVEGIEGIGAVGTVFEEVFLRFRLFSPERCR